jgi:mono/diheme cytochrome c family protein
LWPAAVALLLVTAFLFYWMKRPTEAPERSARPPATPPAAQPQTPPEAAAPAPEAVRPTGEAPKPEPAAPPPGRPGVTDQDPPALAAALEQVGIAPEERLKALTELAGRHRTKPIDELLTAIERADARYAACLPDLTALLVAWEEPDDLVGALDRIRAMARGARSSATRRASYAAWTNANPDSQTDYAYESIKLRREGMIDWLGAIPLLDTEYVRKKLEPLVSPRLIFPLPADLLPTERTAGLRAEVFEPAPPDAGLERFVGLEPKAAGVIRTIDLKSAPARSPQNTAVVIQGAVVAPEDGTYLLTLSSDRPARLYLRGVQVAETDGKTPEAQGSAAMTTGPQDFALTYVDAAGGGAGLSVAWEGVPAIPARRPIPPEALWTSGSVDVRELAIRSLRYFAEFSSQNAQRFKDLSMIMREGHHAEACLEAILSFPPEAWATWNKYGAAGEAVAQAAGVPPAARAASPRYRNAVRFVRKLSEQIDPTKAALLEATLEEIGGTRMPETGRRVFLQNCVRCHQVDGEGLEPEEITRRIPSLVNSGWFEGKEPAPRLIKIVLHGVSGRLWVKGESAIGTMPGLGARLSDEEVAAVINYAGGPALKNKGPRVTREEVAELRKKHADLNRPWTSDDLMRDHPPRED